MTTDPTTFIIYLLHFEQRVGRIQHYIGITRADQMTRRMRAHANGYGCATTRRAFKASVPMRLARTWKVESRSAERSIKDRGHAFTMCPICSPELPLEREKKPGQLLPTGLPAITRFALGWPSPDRSA